MTSIDSRTRRSVRFHALDGATALLLATLASIASPAAEWYVGPAGKPENSGSRESPWDIASALGGERKLSPGDTIYLLAGTYRRRPKADFEVRLAGTEERPIHVRAVPGGRATIDGGLVVQEPSAHLWVRDLEILVSENFSMPREIDEPGSHPERYNRPWGGLHLHGGTGSRYINLVIHDCAQGISAWVGAKDVEIYGCLIYENGWKAPDRGHGHAIYTQNRDGIKTIRHSILSAKYPGSYTLHAYGSARAYVDNYVVEENIAYGEGPFLVGGGRPSRNIRVAGNVLSGVSLRVGYDAPHNESCEVRDNVIAGGRLDIVRYRSAVNEGNVVRSEGDERPREPLVRWFPNRYDPTRAHLAVFTWRKEEAVTIDAEPFLSPGQRFRLMDPRAVFASPVHEGVCEGRRITVPAGSAFRAFVAFKDE